MPKVVDELTVTDNITIPAGKRIGLGDSAARIAFDTGEVKVRDATLGAIRDNVAMYRDVAHYYNSGNPVTGTLKISLPNTYAMMRIVIKGYDYSSKGAWECVLGVYNYSFTSSWWNNSAYIIGNAPFSSVRLAGDATGPCILLGTTSTAWNYPGISIDVQASTGGYLSEGDGWDISLITSESGITVKATLAPTLQTNRLAVGVPSTGLPGFDGDLTVSRTLRLEGNDIRWGTGQTRDGFNPSTGKRSYYDGSTWHDFY